MEKLILVAVFFMLLVASAALQAETAVPRLEFIAKAALPSNFKYKGTEVGGLAGIFYDREKEAWFIVSGDRARLQQPRFYEFKFKIGKRKKGWRFEAHPQNVTILHEKGQAVWKEAPLDLKGIAQLPWGNYLFSSEGFNSQKPRVPPVLLDVKIDGTWARNFALPDEYLPESAGRQTRGVQNNRGPEGLTSSGDGHTIWVAIEAPLVQDKDKEGVQVRILQYEMPEAWIIKPTKSFLYPLGESSQGALLSERGVSELCWLREQELLVMERAFEVSMKRFGYAVKIFSVNLGSKESPLKKKLIFDFKSLGVRIPNFEGMAPGPDLPDGRKTLLVVSDNNFKQGEGSEFWLFAWKAD